MDGFIEGIESNYKGFQIICAPNFEDQKMVWTVSSTILRNGIPSSYGFYFEAVEKEVAVNGCKAMSEDFIDTLKF